MRKAQSGPIAKQEIYLSWLEIGKELIRRAVSSLFMKIPLKLSFRLPLLALAFCPVLLKSPP